MPVDPRDILRGDYVDLAYEIGRSEKALAYAKTLPESGPVYATLILGEDNRVREYSFSLTEPESGLYIRGEGFVREVDVYTENKDKKWSPIITKEKQGNISYPQIEQFYVPEGKWWAIDRMGWANSGKKLEIKIALWKYGKAQILQLLVDGEPIDFSQIESENPWTDEPVRPEPEAAVPPAPPVEKV